MTLSCERLAQNYSLESLSQVLNISPQVLHSIEKGKAGLNAERAEKIAYFFNKPIEYFFVPTYYRVRK
ncbi:helix-turn-helix transcriptional regulator [Bacillus pseudomycoides]|uniref:helix-turn-helix domain-containing protein n=1 Tax=Bacillus pseudomycoides TaxID=64104 RepID=UPI0005340DE9|nr:helix-turn-helix transcriptional regulator [Bacillus pseudomycoides]MED1598107.1 helix-turn-helix transcriptional regulator [Bacillus pseudomycoides]PEU30367.1 XRE family transcriptional regulator [Bacillus pseudomycoides]